jgi:porphobilinogen deaminase
MFNLQWLRQQVLVLQVQGLLRRVRPEWTEGHFELLEYTTHGDREKTEQLRTLGQGAFTGAHASAVPRPQGRSSKHTVQYVLFVQK